MQEVKKTKLRLIDNELVNDMQEYGERKEDSKTPSWFYTDENNKKAVSVLGIAQEIMTENSMITFDSFKKGYRYDNKLGHWRVGYQNYLGKVISDKLHDVGFWKPNTFNSTQLFISNHIYSDVIGNVFDKSAPNLVSFKNGTYDIDTDTIKPNDPNDHILNGHGYNLDMESDTPVTDAWFKESFQDADTFMKEFIGYAFYRSYEPFQKFVVLLGTGNDGKSTFLNYAIKLIGESNTSNVDLKGLTGDRANFNTSALYGKELNYFADISKDYLKDSSKLKSLTGNDSIQAEFKGKDSFNFKNYAKLIFSANELPTFTDFTKGFKRRPGLVKYHFIPDFTDKFDMKQIEAEIPAFAYKCMVAFKKALDRKTLSESSDMEDQNEKWFEENNHMANFVSEMCVIDLNNEDGEASSVIYSEYKKYCDAQGYKARSQPQLTRYLEDEGIKHIKKQINGDRVWRYIHLAVNDSRGINFK